ncbi:MAG: PH domain-containing protein [Anaerohalosphaeraceae bacterium]
MERERKRKPCPFCGEQILADAVKCRWCREFLTEEDDSLPVSHHAGGFHRAGKNDSQGAPQPSQKPQRPTETFCLYPSVWGAASTLFGAGLAVLFGLFLMVYPFSSLIAELFDSRPYPPQILLAIRLLGGLLAAAAVLKTAVRILCLKSISYQISPDRIEWRRGLLSRKVDNLDMFRVVDIKMHRSLSDRLFGIGRITLITNDKTDPTFKFEKIRRPWRVYDYIKAASLAADRKQGVVHLE